VTRVRPMARRRATMGQSKEGTPMHLRNLPLGVMPKFNRTERHAQKKSRGAERSKRQGSGAPLSHHASAPCSIPRNVGMLILSMRFDNHRPQP